MSWYQVTIFYYETYDIVIKLADYPIVRYTYIVFVVSSINKCKNWPPWYNWNIVEIGVKYHKPLNSQIWYMFVWRNLILRISEQSKLYLNNHWMQVTIFYYETYDIVIKLADYPIVRYTYIVFVTKDNMHYTFY
jgi:hypothetical protein